MTINLKTAQKQEAIKRLKALGVMDDVLTAFVNDDIVYKSEYLNRLFPAVLYHLDTTEQQIVSDFEKEYEALVYHIQKVSTDFGDLYSLFYVSSHRPEWKADNDELADGYAFVYVYNASYPELSEFGSISFEPAMGGIVRTS